MSFDALVGSIGTTLGARLRPKPDARVHGGSINECYRWQSSAGPIFVKVAPIDGLPMLEAELAGLDELRRAGALRVPKVLGTGGTATTAWLALEWIQFGGRTAAAEAVLGERLALQHRRRAAAFGWDRDNTIGSTRQLNERTDDWIEFFRDRRLRFQLELAARNGCGSELQSRGERLLDRLEAFFGSYRPVPSLVHGDLWGGNWGVDDSGAPVIFDPAVYYGDRETDVAMTRLFGGFGASFYAAYSATWPLDPGARTRTALYNLYHVLNHCNLFGGGYLVQARAMIEALLGELAG
jgi:fructosamine-3-kinase